MSLRNKGLMLFTGCLLVALASTASAGERWLHINVDDRSGGGERVRVQLPLSLIEALAPLVETEELSGGRVQLGHHDLDKAEMRALLAAVRDAEDGEYVRVDSDTERVRVAKRDNYLHVDVQEEDGWGDLETKVRVRVPMAVVEAMLAGDDEELDILAGIRALDAFGELELVTVEDEESRVRVWIDEKKSEL